jgi:hypothetical protein
MLIVTDYESFSQERLDALGAEGRYRVFADLAVAAGFRAPLITASVTRSRSGARTTISA